MTKYVVFVFWGIVAIFLALVSINSEGTSAILAEVEPQRYAISFPKAVKIKEFYVVPGQRVKQGDPLVKVERPDLIFERETKLNRIDQLAGDLVKREAQKDNQLYLNKIQSRLRRNELQNQIEQLQLIIQERKSLSDELQKLNYMNQNAPADSVLERNLALLRKQVKTSDEEEYVRAQELNSLFELEKAAIQADIGLLRKELSLLQTEEEELMQYSRVDGTIGNVYVELEELVPSYTNIISVYEDNPTIIRAFTNEHSPIEIESGRQVYVESTNRRYRIKGEVIEVGSRIIEYPLRLRTFDRMPSWGRELFIKIPDESKFLNGEKVFVILEE